MSSTESEAVAAARAYEALHVPALFQDWVEPMLDSAAVGPGDRVLDVACGTGVLARGAAERVGRSGRVAGVDPGPGMLSVASEIAPSLEWRQGTAESLPFPDGSFDAVVSQFGMMFFSDASRAAREMLRVLDDGGRLAVAVWDSLESSPAFAAEVALLEELAGSRAADALKAPFALGDRAELAAVFEEAGAGSVVVSTREGTARFPDARTLVEVDLRGWLPLMGVDLSEELIVRILDRADAALADFITSDGRLVFTAPGHIVTGAKLQP